MTEPKWVSSTAVANFSSLAGGDTPVRTLVPHPVALLAVELDSDSQNTPGFADLSDNLLAGSLDLIAHLGAIPAAL